MKNLDDELNKILAETVQVSRIGRATDPKPEGRVWFTTQMQDLFVLDFDYAKSQLEALIERKEREAYLEGQESMAAHIKNLASMCEEAQTEELATLKAEGEKL